MSDPVNPDHYKSHPSGVEAIDICEWLPFNIGNAVKYCWRSGLKGEALEDLRKAQWYLQRAVRSGPLGYDVDLQITKLSGRVIEAELVEAGLDPVQWSPEDYKRGSVPLLAKVLHIVAYGCVSYGDILFAMGVLREEIARRS